MLLLLLALSGGTWPFFSVRHSSTRLVAGMPTEERLALRDEVREMFAHGGYCRSVPASLLNACTPGYFSYKKHAFPMDELKPLSCKGARAALLFLPV